MNSADELIGQSVLLSIGEPWDFESDDGPNLLRGTITGVKGGLLQKEIVVVDVTPFEVGGQHFNRLSASARYVGGRIANELLSGRQVNANLSLNLLTGLIGSIELAS